MSITRAHGVDISKWQDIYRDDNIDEGFPLDFVIQKSAQGLTNYANSLSYAYGAWWKAQYDSIEHFEIKGTYIWFETELDPVKQANILVQNLELYDFGVVDYEAYQNVINKTTALSLKQFIDVAKSKTDKPIILYSNWWIYEVLKGYLGNWVDTVAFWYAGGAYYNQIISEPIADGVQPILPADRTDWELWQYSADGNKLADELDFGQNESASIDLDIFNGTVEDMKVWLGLKKESEPTPDTPEETIEKYLTLAKHMIELAIELVKSEKGA